MAQSVESSCFTGVKDLRERKTDVVKGRKIR